MTLEVDDVILMGGMYWVPRVQEIVVDIFGKMPSKHVNPDEAMKMGVAIQSEIMLIIKQILLLDVTHISLGLETLGGVFTRLISRNTTTQ